MDTKKKNGIGRRRFLQNASKTALSLACFGFAATRNTFAAPSFAADLADPAKHFTTPQIETRRLNNGISMPVLGFGTCMLSGPSCSNYVAQAITCGYRLIDTAKVYRNEEAVGAGIKQSGIDRKELFLTSKLWVDDAGKDKAKKAFQLSLDKLGTDYLDLYLIHRPRGDVKGSWKAMEELYKEGKIRAIGVSNFEPHHLEELLSYASLPPAINQIESHVFFQQGAASENLNKLGIQMEAWSPLAEGRNSLFCNQTLKEIGEKYNKTIAQVSLRWNYQRGIIVIPRSSKKYHMMENLEIFDFVLDGDDMQKIAALDLNRTQFPEWE